MQQIAKGLLSWASVLEDSTREQALQTVRMPFVRPHVALMPDAHLGMGSTVGSVIPTERAVMPATVGVDIGCGMAAVRTQLTRADVDANGSGLPALREAIEAAVPVSKGGYNTELTDTATIRVAEMEAKADKAGFDPGSYAGNWRLQVGTLGSGNDESKLIEFIVPPGAPSAAKALIALGIAATALTPAPSNCTRRDHTAQPQGGGSSPQTEPTAPAGIGCPCLSAWTPSGPLTWRASA